ncbi:tubulin polyglutamylase TTLL11 [Lampris incognitus]|uniref:tubulin polyglutamylase TTLL11 n=1 Tax=Lampris incognitus TaxID=2546036 RepID=UPI0024B5B692|nr:tubulin polyglutamylase TTLL11 [Lampris incognitus]
MNDCAVNANVHREQVKACGEDAEEGGTADAEGQAPVASSPAVTATLSGIPASACRDAADTAAACERGKSRGKPGKNENAPGKGDRVSQPHGAAAPLAGKHLRRIENEMTLGLRGTGKTPRGKTEAHGSVAPHHRPKDERETRGEESAKFGKKTPVSVDTSKARASAVAIKTSVKQLKWKEFPVGRRAACDIYWHGMSFHDSESVVSGQVNKFPGMVEMLKKINLSRAVRTMQELFPEEYNFYPRAWILPDEYQQFSEQFQLVKDNDVMLKPTFIVKPDGGSQGEGIYLIRDPSDIKLTMGSQLKQAIVQEYIEKPLLIDKLKFDIRLYVLIKSLEPLEIYIGKEGLTRFCTEPYEEPSRKNISHIFMHLTNYALNVQSCHFVHSDSLNAGSKRTFSSVLYQLGSKGADIKRVWSDIISLVIKTVIAMVPELKVYYQGDIPPGKPGPTCFQILGFDILLMKNLKPVLIEVNANPSMRIEYEQEVAPGVFVNVSSPVDKEVKVGVIRDTLRLMDPSPKRQSISEQVAGAKRAGAMKESQEDEETLPSSCMKQVYPKYTKQFDYLRLLERITALFIRFLGVRGSMRLGPTAFRTFIRKCKLSNSSFSMASVDILYIDITRRQAGFVPDSRETGMGLQAFIEAFFQLAGRRYKSLALREQVVSLLEQCEAQLKSQLAVGGPAFQERRSLSCSRALTRGTRNQASGISNFQLHSPAPIRRAASQDYQLDQNLKPTRGRCGALSV